MIVFCTTCKGRAQHIEQTLPKNLADNPSAESKFVILNYNSPDHLLAYLKANHRGALESGKVVVYSFPHPGPFRMAHAKNMAHRLGILEGGDILVNLDADNFTGPGFSEYIAEQFQTGEKIFLWARVRQLDGEKLPRGASGRIVVTAKAFLSAGGYDEKYEAWGPDDKDFNTRLRNLNFEPREIDRRYIGVVLHNDKMRFREYPHAKTSEGVEDFSEGVRSSAATIANFGEVGTGVVFRNLNRTPIKLEPIPTRIFGIGMHKTGTTSLHLALEMLGFNSAHWTSAHWAKAIWVEMKEFGRSRTLENSYAASDLPISLLFRDLDRVYPGSKFILTTRSEAAWLQSVRNHWSRERNPFRSQWDSDPFTHQVHKELYGQRGFDAETFLARFRRHNAEVKEYFKDRPGDLLVMDAQENAGWLELCGFLGRPIPPLPYPKAFTTIV